MNIGFSIKHEINNHTTNQEYAMKHCKLTVYNIIAV